MAHPGFTIKDATLTTFDATKYEFNSNICYHILLKDKFSVVKWYQCGDYHMFFSLASYPSDEMSPPKTQEEFGYGLVNQHTMYYFQTEHMYVFELALVEQDGIIACIGKNDEDEWTISETEGCLGVYRLEGNTLNLIYDNYADAFQNGLVKWKSKWMGILERSAPEDE